MKSCERPGCKCKPSKHHITPRSRGGKNGGNLAEICENFHQGYHFLFSDKTPKEILALLVDYFWGGQVEHVESYLAERNGQPKGRRAKRLAKATAATNGGGAQDGHA